MVQEYKTLGKIKMGFFDPLNEDYTRLLVEPKKKFVLTKVPDHGLNPFSLAKYEDSLPYFIQKEDTPINGFTLSKSKILNS